MFYAEQRRQFEAYRQTPTYQARLKKELEAARQREWTLQRDNAAFGYQAPSDEALQQKIEYGDFAQRLNDYFMP